MQTVQFTLEIDMYKFLIIGLKLIISTLLQKFSSDSITRHTNPLHVQIPSNAWQMNTFRHKKYVSQISFNGNKMRASAKSCLILFYASLHCPEKDYLSKSAEAEKSVTTLAKRIWVSIYLYSSTYNVNRNPYSTYCNRK